MKEKIVTCDVETMREAKPFTEIIPNIYVGSINSKKYFDIFDIIVTSAIELKPTNFPGKENIYIPLADYEWKFEENIYELYTLYNMGHYLAQKLLEGQKILFLCNMGMNRSSLMAAMTMLNIGYNYNQIINKLKKRHPCVLFNPSFTRAIKYASNMQ